jgi:hypothetical protein
MVAGSGESGHGQDGQEHYQGQQGGQILLSFHLSFLLYFIGFLIRMSTIK